MSVLAELKHAVCVPIIHLDNVESAVELAQLFIQHDFRVLEVVMRSSTAWDCLHAIRQACPDVTLGAGSLVNVEQCQRAVELGANFLVSPGCSFDLADAMLSRPGLGGVTWVPGVATPSEMMGMQELGYDLLKLFPAGGHGLTLLKAVGPVFPELRFWASGGIDPAQFGDYLALENVAGIASSAMASMALEGDIASLEALRKGG